MSQLLLVCLLVLSSSQVFAWEKNVDRPGSDFENFPIENDPSVCEQFCRIKKRCVAWTFVRMKPQEGKNAHCWLKDRIPNRTNNSCCISGTKRKHQSRGQPIDSGPELIPID